MIANFVRWLTRQLITADPHEARERTRLYIQRIRDQQRAAMERNLAKRLRMEMWRGRANQVSRIYEEIERV